MQGGEEQDWGYLVPWGELKRRYDSVKAPEPQGKDQIAREGGNMRVAFGLREQCLGIWAKWSHFRKTFLKTHLGFDPIYKTQKWFSPRSSGLIHNIFYFLIFRVLT